MNNFHKIGLSVIVSSMLTVGVVLGVQNITSITQTASKGDIITSTWVNEVNTILRKQQAPSETNPLFGLYKAGTTIAEWNNLVQATKTISSNLTYGGATSWENSCTIKPDGNWKVSLESRGDGQSDRVERCQSFFCNYYCQQKEMWSFSSQGHRCMPPGTVPCPANHYGMTCICSK